MALLYLIDIILCILLLAQLSLISLQIHYHQRALFLAENFLFAAGFILMTFASIINPHLFFVFAYCLCAVILMIAINAALYRKYPNSTTLFMSRSNLIFGYILLLGILSVEPVVPLTTINLIAISPNGLEKILPGLTWLIVLKNLYVSYPIFYIGGALAALFAYWQNNKKCAKYLMLLPVLPISLVLIAWLSILLHFVVTKQFYVALTF